MRFRSFPIMIVLLLLAIPLFALPPNLVKGGAFDDPSALQNWVSFANGQVDKQWSDVDALGQRGSGSVSVGAKNGGIAQCVPVTGGLLYDFGARVLVPRRQQKLFPMPGPSAYVKIDFFTSPTCSGGNFFGEKFSDQAIPGPLGRFIAVHGQVIAPFEAAAALITLVSRDERMQGVLPGDPSLFDDVYMQEAGGCAPDDRTLCLAGGKLRAVVTAFDAHGTPLDIPAIQISPITGYFYTYSSDDPELTIKAYDLASFGKWLVVGGMTDLRLIIRVEDLERQEERTFTNDAGHFLSPIVDVFPEK